jgi:hypothetical protein
VVVVADRRNCRGCPSRWRSQRDSRSDCCGASGRGLRGDMRIEDAWSCFQSKQCVDEPHEVETCRHQQRHAIACHDAVVPQDACELLGILAKLAPGDGRSAE